MEDTGRPARIRDRDSIRQRCESKTIIESLYSRACYWCTSIWIKRGGSVRRKCTNPKDGTGSHMTSQVVSAHHQWSFAHARSRTVLPEFLHVSRYVATSGQSYWEEVFHFPFEHMFRISIFRGRLTQSAAQLSRLNQLAILSRG